jgi:TetR/AcrR family transcriptional regulator, fatty acid metabolism regulator protein
MASPRVPDRQPFIDAARRAQIVSSAIEEIAECGHYEVSTDRIAERAAVSPEEVLAYFPHPDHMVAAVVTQVFAAGAAVMIPALRAQDSYAGKLAAYIEANARVITADPVAAVAVLQIWTSFRNPEGKRLDEVLAADSPPPAEFAELDPVWILREGQRRGEFRQFDIRAMALALRYTIDGATIELSRDPDFDVVGYCGELVELFDRATRRQP